MVLLVYVLLLDLVQQGLVLVVAQRDILDLLLLVQDVPDAERLLELVDGNDLLLFEIGLLRQRVLQLDVALPLFLELVLHVVDGLLEGLGLDPQALDEGSGSLLLDDDLGLLRGEGLADFLDPQVAFALDLLQGVEVLFAELLGLELRLGGVWLQGYLEELLLEREEIGGELVILLDQLGEEAGLVDLFFGELALELEFFDLLLQLGFLIGPSLD